MDIHIAGPKGLGDALYMRAIALHLIDSGASVAVSTRWPDVFAGAPVSFKKADEGARQVGFSIRHPLGPGIYAGYNGWCQFDIWCHRAGISEKVDFDLRWKVIDRDLVQRIRTKSDGRKILLYQPRKTRSPLQPEAKAFYGWVRDADYFRVRMGHPEYVEDEGECELDLLGKASVADILDVATVSDMFFGELCYIGILADAMRKRSVCMLSKEHARAEEWRHLNARRLFCNPNLTEWIYD